MTIRIPMFAHGLLTLVALSGCDIVDGVETTNCEVCDGVDNNGDGNVDEGFSDTDGDGKADCIDEEECDGLDNNGDGAVDEGYTDTDEDGIADCVDEEECDGLDNNGDGQIDEGFDANGNGIGDCLEEAEICDCEDNNGDGQIDEGCEYEVYIAATADDTMEAWLDGSSWFTSAGWSTVDSASAVVDAGTHHIAVHASDIGHVVAGFHAAVYIDGQLEVVTGEGDWVGTATAPATGWETSTAGMTGDDNAPCGYSYIWGTPNAFIGLGSSWVWFDDCRDTATYTDNWFVLELDVCGAYGEDVEECNGLDDDGDGEIDEDFPDTDEDGIADCMDAEECDGLDNDGDGNIDEGYDADSDGIADCFDEETCFDDIDNDGDGEVDEDCWGACPTPEEVVTCTISGEKIECDSDAPIKAASATTYAVDMASYTSIIVEGDIRSAKDWAMHWSNSPSNDGWSGDGSDNENDSEAFFYGTSLFVYDSDRGSSSAVLSVGSAVDATSDSFSSVICDGYFGFESGSTAFTDVSSDYIFQIDGDEPDAQAGGTNDTMLYLGVNQTVGSSSRSGGTVSNVTIRLGN
ncbi:MAG: hypothetical protein ACI8S6_002550 [Myxococcota bacterium]|jgi:hypothetical protein